jgi:hypothetical protein
MPGWYWATIWKGCGMKRLRLRLSIFSEILKKRTKISLMVVVFWSRFERSTSRKEVRSFPGWTSFLGLDVYCLFGTRHKSKTIPFIGSWIRYNIHCYLLYNITSYCPGEISQVMISCMISCVWIWQLVSAASGARFRWCLVISEVQYS